jgi:hypothetical protein
MNHSLAEVGDDGVGWMALSLASKRNKIETENLVQECDFCPPAMLTGVNIDKMMFRAQIEPPGGLIFAVFRLHLNLYLTRRA